MSTVKERLALVLKAVGVESIAAVVPEINSAETTLSQAVKLLVERGDRELGMVLVFALGKRAVFNAMLGSFKNQEEAKAAVTFIGLRALFGTPVEDHMLLVQIGNALVKDKFANDLKGDSEEDKFADIILRAAGLLEQYGEDDSKVPSFPWGDDSDDTSGDVVSECVN